MDTVFDPGTAAERPFRIDGGTAFGPGVTDMKSGLLAGLYAVKTIIGELGGLPFERLTFIANPDEEVGSPTSEVHIRAAAADVDATLVLECARANGDIVSARKGILDTRLTVHGRAAHAGVEPEKGRSAILEAARIVQALHALNGRWPGVSVNVGKIAGGTRPNVVPERCELEVDVRATTVDGLAAVEAAIRELVATTELPDTSVEANVMISWQPMEKLARSGRLVEHAQSVAGRLGFTVADTATGGASDANTTSGMGVPTIDGLGPIGGNDHAPGEYLDVDSVVPRTAMLAGLLLAIARDPEVLGVAGGRPAVRSRDHMTGEGEGGGGAAPANGAGSPAPAGRRRISSGGPWEAVGGLQPGCGRGRLVLGRRDDRRRSGWALAASRRRGGSGASGLRRSSSGRWPTAGSRSPTSSGPGCSSSTWPMPQPCPRSTARSSGRSGPAATMVAVAGLMDPSLLVEIEAEARRG